MFELGKKVAVLYIQQSDVEMIEPALGVDLVMCVCTGCNDPERVNSESLDSTNFIRHWRTISTCVSSTGC